MRIRIGRGIQEYEAVFYNEVAGELRGVVGGEIVSLAKVGEATADYILNCILHDGWFSLSAYWRDDETDGGAEEAH